MSPVLGSPHPEPLATRCPAACPSPAALTEGPACWGLSSPGAWGRAGVPGHFWLWPPARPPDGPSFLQQPAPLFPSLWASPQVPWCSESKGVRSLLFHYLETTAVPSGGDACRAALQRVSPPTGPGAHTGGQGTCQCLRPAVTCPPSPSHLRGPWHWWGALCGGWASRGGGQRRRPVRGWPGPPAPAAGRTRRTAVGRRSAGSTPS